MKTSFPIHLLWAIIFVMAVVFGCSERSGHTDGAVFTTDSIAYWLQMSKSQPDSMVQEAYEYGNKAWQMAMKNSPGHSVMIEVCYNLGIQAEKVGNFELAIFCFQETDKMLGDKNRTAMKGNVLNYIGNISFRQGRNDMAMENFRKALEIRTLLNDREGQASSNFYLGSVYQREEKYREAQEQYEQSLNMYIQLENDMGKADCFNNLGGLCFELDDQEKAIEYFLQAEEIYLKNQNVDKLPYVYNNIGNSYNFMGDSENARLYYFKMLQTSQTSHPAVIAEAYYSIGTFFDEYSQPDSAIYYYSKAIEIANPLNLHGILHLSHEKRGLLNAWKQNYREAYIDSESRRIAYEKVVNLNTTKAFTQQAMQHEFSILQQEQMFRNRIMTISIIALSSVVLLICTGIYMLYRGYVQKQKANALLEKQQKEITESIRYASMIQKATLPSKKFVDIILPDHFIYYMPRDIVSGDFYWINWIDHHIIVAAADCTGHGVPGAFVSMLGISLLNKITAKMETLKADEILNELRNEVVLMLNPKGSIDSRRDGMDISLAIIDTETREIEFCGAYNSLYLVRDGQLIEKKANRMPVGLYDKLVFDPFTVTRFNYFNNDLIYMFSDGYSDQFGGKDGTKFKSKNFKELLLTNATKPLSEQMQIIEDTHLKWRGDIPQVDDILVMGIKLT